MGDLGGLQRLALGAGVVGVGAGIALQLTGTAAAKARAERRAANEDQPATKWQRLGDAPADNLDGWLRIGTLAVGAGALATAGVALVARRPRIAIGSAGVALGAAGAGLLTGTGSPAARLEQNTNSMLTAWSGSVHATLVPKRPDVDAQRPTVASGPTRERPSAAAIRDADLQLSPGSADEARAKADAEKALAQIDWSKPDIVLWMPGTTEHVMAGNWIKGVEQDMRRPASAVIVDYPATMDFDASVATGMRTLQLVLAGIAEHGGTHRVLAGGYSQGAWIIGDALETPQIRDSIDRVALFGHPGLAQRHYSDRSDPKVLEVNDGSDPITLPAPDRQLLIDATKDMADGAMLAHPVRSALALAQNPTLSTFWGARSIDLERWAGNDPHEYYGSYKRALAWLDEAPLPVDDHGR